MIFTGDDREIIEGLLPVVNYDLIIELNREISCTDRIDDDLWLCVLLEECFYIRVRRLYIFESLILDICNPLSIGRDTRCILIVLQDMTRSWYSIIEGHEVHDLVRELLVGECEGIILIIEYLRCRSVDYIDSSIWIDPNIVISRQEVALYCIECIEPVEIHEGMSDSDPRCLLRLHREERIRDTRSILSDDGLYDILERSIIVDIFPCSVREEILPEVVGEGIDREGSRITVPIVRVVLDYSRSYESITVIEVEYLLYIRVRIPYYSSYFIHIIIFP